MNIPNEFKFKHRDYNASGTVKLLDEKLCQVQWSHWRNVYNYPRKSVEALVEMGTWTVEEVILPKLYPWMLVESASGNQYTLALNTCGEWNYCFAPTGRPYGVKRKAEIERLLQSGTWKLLKHRGDVVVKGAIIADLIASATPEPKTVLAKGFKWVVDPTASYVDAAKRYGIEMFVTDAGIYKLQLRGEGVQTTLLLYYVGRKDKVVEAHKLGSGDWKVDWTPEFSVYYSNDRMAEFIKDGTWVVVGVK